MKPHPKLRKTIKSGGLVVTVLLVVVWIASTRWAIVWHPKRSEVVVAIIAGSIVVHDHSESPDDIVLDSRHRGWRFERSLSARMVWWPFVPRWQPLWMDLPIWCFVPVPLLATLAAWRLDSLARRRAHLTPCPKCNYDRAGLAKNAPCPECGTPHSPASL